MPANEVLMRPFNETEITENFQLLRRKFWLKHIQNAIPTVIVFLNGGFSKVCMLMEPAVA